MRKAPPLTTHLPPAERIDPARRSLCAALVALPALTLGCGGSGGAAAPEATALALAATHTLANAWASSSINVSVFREQSVLAIGAGGYLVAYVDEAGHVCLQQLSTAGQSLRRIKVEPRLSDALLADGHCSASLGLSADQRLHLMYGAHDTLPFYASLPISTLIGLPNGATLQATAWPQRISYPQFYNIGDSLQLWFRADPANEIHRQIYDPGQPGWPASSEQLLTPGQAERVYMNQLAVQGNRVALPWLYRLVSTDDHVRNQGLWLAWSEDGGRQWLDSHGAPLQWPLTYGDKAALMAVPSSQQLLNQTSSRFGPDGRLYLTWYAKDSNNRHQLTVTTVAGNGQVLRTEAASDSLNTFDLLGRGTLVLPLSRPQIVVSARFIHLVYRQDDRLVLASRPTGDGNEPWRYLRLDVGGLEAWEPSISAMHWENWQKLVVYVQAARQGQLDTSAPWPAQPARLYVFTETAMN